MSTIRKTISISRKDPILQELIRNVGSYEVSHVIRTLMYDGLKYRALVEQGVVSDINLSALPQKSTNIERKSLNNEENEQKTLKNDEKPLNNEENEQKTVKNIENKPKIDDFDDFNEDFDVNSIELEEIDENDEDLEDLLLNNG